MSDPRGIPPGVADALGQLRRDIAPFWQSFGPVVEVDFPAAVTKRDIEHGLEGRVPDGYVILWADGLIYAEPGVEWTPTTAYMRADAANVHARLRFFVFGGTTP